MSAGEWEALCREVLCHGAYRTKFGLLRFSFDADFFRDLLRDLYIDLERAFLRDTKDTICRFLDFLRTGATDFLGDLCGLRLDDAYALRCCIGEILFDYDFYAYDDKTNDGDGDYDDKFSSVLVLRSDYRFVCFFGYRVCRFFDGDFRIYRFCSGFCLFGAGLVCSNLSPEILEAP